MGFSYACQDVQIDTPCLDGLSKGGGLEIVLLHKSNLTIVRFNLDELDIYIQDGGACEPEIEKAERDRLAAALERLIERVKNEPAC